jgi:hypothetical protein
MAEKFSRATGEEEAHAQSKAAANVSFMLGQALLKRM